MQPRRHDDTKAAAKEGKAERSWRGGEDGADDAVRTLTYESGVEFRQRGWWGTATAALFFGASCWAMFPENRLHDSGAWFALGWMGIGAVAVVMFGVERWRVRRAGLRGRRWAAIFVLLGGVVGGVGMLRLIVQPPSGRSRETAHRVKCALHIREIRNALRAYADDHGGKYPTRLEQAVVGYGVSAGVLVCPSTGDRPARRASREAVAEALKEGGHLSYVYLGAGSVTEWDGDVVILFERMENHRREGMNVLLGDGHVEFVGARLAREIEARAAAGERPVVLKAPAEAAAENE